MSEILRKFKWILFLLIPLFFETNTANAESHSVWLDSTFTKYQIDVNPYFLQEHLNGLNSVETGDSLDFSYVFSGLNPESRVYVYQMNGDSITSIRVGDSVFFYMPDEDVYLSIKNPVYEIIYDSDYIDYFDGYNNPTAVEAGSIVNIVFKKGIIPGGTQQLWGGWYIFDGITVHDSVASFVMPYGNVKLTAARMTDLEIMDNIQCEGGTLRHSETGNAGDTIFFNACPDKGYYIRTIYVSNSEDFKKLDDTTYSFVMLPNLPVWINVCFEKAPIYHSISVDSTFAKYNITVNPYWLRNSKGLDSILVGEQLDFMYMFRGLNYESTVSVREKNGGLIYKHMMGDSVDFFMPDSNIVLSVENPVYEITYDSAYINHFNGFSYPISAEAGTTVKILYEGDIIARVSRETWNGSWTTMDETTIGWERSNTWSVTFTMPFTNVLVGSAQTKDLPIYKQINCGEGQINCPQEVGNARDTIWFTVHPDAGYTIQSVNVTGGRQFHAWDDTTYMFEMVEDKSATIYACFTPISRSNSIIVDPSCKDYMKEYGSIYLIADGYFDAYEIGTQTTIESVLMGVKVTMAHFKDLRDKSLVRVRTESGKTVEYETMSELDSIWFTMPCENVYISMEKAHTPYYTITVDSSCKDYMKEYGSIYLTAEGYSHGYRINTQSTIDSVLKGVKVTMAHFKDLRDKSLVRVRTESGKTVEYETISELDSIWFAMPNENIYISMEEDHTPYYTITVDASCKDKMDEYGSVYLTAEGYSHGYRVNTHSTIDSVEKGVRVTLAHFKDLSQKSLVKVRTESGKTVEYETVTEFDSIWFAMPNENIYISMEEAATKVNIDTIVICGKGWISAPTSGNAKDTIWFSVHPAVGYHVQFVEVSGNTPIHLWDDTTYIFKLVAGKDVQITVCFAIDMICGCTDPAALNYDSLATVRDNSCIYPTVIYGCTDPKALNYDPEATHNSGLCEYVKEIGGCTDANALNYDSLATYNDGSCQYPREIIHGCTDTFALNYNPYAEIDNNTCEYRTVSDTIVGCMDAKAINYNPLASVSSECIYEKVDSVIVVEGCTDPKAANYNEKATKEDGSCVYANPISTYNDVAEVIVNDNQEVVVVVDTVKSIGVVETNGCEIDFAEKIDSVSVKVLSYDDDELITNWEVYQAGSVIYYDNVTVTCTEKEFVVLNLSLICNKNMKKPSGLRAKSTKVYAATLRSLVDLRDFGTTTIVLDENVASLYVYPNPASEIIYVEAPSLKDKTLQMVNLNGEVVKVVKANSNKLQITVGDLTAGAYILFSQDGSVSETVIIK